jgi:hypothetical protein
MIGNNQFIQTKRLNIGNLYQDVLFYEYVDILIANGYIDENYLTDPTVPEVWRFPLDFTESELNLTEININITR